METLQRRVETWIRDQRTKIMKVTWPPPWRMVVRWPWHNGSREQQMRIQEELERRKKQFQELCFAVKAETISDLQEILCCMVLSECVYKEEAVATPGATPARCNNANMPSSPEMHWIISLKATVPLHKQKQTKSFEEQSCLNRALLILNQHGKYLLTYQNQTIPLTKPKTLARLLRTCRKNRVALSVRNLLNHRTIM